MKKYLLLILLLLLTSCSSSSSSKTNILPEGISSYNDSPVYDLYNTSIGTPFELKVDQSAEIEGHIFTFKEVSSDSRCPLNALCIWDGEATVVLVSLDDEGNEGYVYLSTNSTEAYQYLFPQTNIQERCRVDDGCTITQPSYKLAYVVSLVSLSPQPEVGKEINPEDYVATLVVGLSE